MTSFDDIYDLALIEIRDYKLDNLASTGRQDILKTILEGYMMKAISDSGKCKVDLSFDKDTETFLNDIPYDVQNVIAGFIVYYWFSSVVNDITQVNLHLQGRDKKTHSESANLKEKGIYLSDLYKRINQKVTDFRIDNLNTIFET